MSNISVEISFIASIFVAGLALGYTVSVLAGVGFIIAANIVLPLILKLSQPSMLVMSKLPISKH